MYTLKDNGIIQEIICGNNFEYVLEDNTHFVNTDYKVLQSQSNGIFVQCMKMTRNGKLSLYYVTDDYRPMSSMFAGLTSDTLIAVAVNLFASVIEVRNNGFLACQCIDVSWDKIFVEQSTLKVKLVYLPLNVKAFDSYAEFESELRSSIVKLINKVVVDVSDRLKQFVLDLCNGSLSVEEVYNRSRNIGAPAIQRPENAKNVASINAPSMNTANTIFKLVAMNAPGHFEIVIDKADVLIGKKQEMVDKVITFNNMISRKHCRIANVNGAYFISDEGSANGTFVNSVRVTKGQRCQIKKGDIIRLADSDFQIV